MQNIYNYMPSTQYTYCKQNIQVINGSGQTDLKLFCDNVITSYESANANPIVSTQNYLCEYFLANGDPAYTYVGMKLFAKQQGRVNIINANNKKETSLAYVPAITVCNQRLY